MVKYVEISSELSNKIATIQKMYKNCSFEILTFETHVKLRWQDDDPFMVNGPGGQKVVRKLKQVQRILGEKFMEFDWGHGWQVVYCKL